MPEQQHELLEQGDLQQHEAGAEGAEVREPYRPSRARPVGPDEQRSDDEDQDQGSRDAEQREQRAEPVPEEHRLAEGDVELFRQARRVEEEGPVVGRGADVERILGEKPLTIGREDQTTVVGGARPGTDHFRGLCRDRIGLYTRRIQDREFQIVGELPQLDALRPR